jgi:hypothetical protein
MSTEIVETWKRFIDVLKLYSNAHLLLNSPASTDEIQNVEGEINLELPSTLKSLLALNNGQLIDDEGMMKGIFKSISGWDIYERHVFLSVRGISNAYKSLIDNKVLVEEFGIHEVPFAVALRLTPYSQIQYKEAFCINSLTGIVSLIWTQPIDPINPPEWQIAKFRRAGSLKEFIERQIELYK